MWINNFIQWKLHVKYTKDRRSDRWDFGGTRSVMLTSASFYVESFSIWNVIIEIAKVVQIAGPFIAIAIIESKT